MSQVSIIIPLYNCEAYIEPCIRSLQNQTLTDIEIIVVDDGSIDRGPELCIDFARQDSRIHVLRQENQGVSAARNLGIRNAAGTYVAFLDADDWVDSTLYQQLLDAAEGKRAEMALAGIVFEHPGNSVVHALPFAGQDLDTNAIKTFLIPALIAGRTPEGTLTGCYVGTALYRRALLLANNVWFHTELKRSEDPLFLLEAVEGCTNICALEFSGYHYRKNVGSTSGHYFPQMVEQWILANPFFNRFEDLNPQASQALLARRFLSMSMEFKNYSLQGTPYSFWQQRTQIRNSIKELWAHDLLEDVRFQPAPTYQRLITKLCRMQLYTLVAFLYWLRTKLQRESVF